jgi:hypothetical protein
MNATHDPHASELAVHVVARMWPAISATACNSADDKPARERSNRTHVHRRLLSPGRREVGCCRAVVRDRPLALVDEALFGDWSGKTTDMPLPADTSPFAAFTASAGGPTLTVANEHFGAFQPAIRSLGSVTETAVRSFERERDRAEAALVASVFAGSPVPDPVKASYCFWATLHPSLVKTLAAKHAAFFASLRC